MQHKLCDKYGFDTAGRKRRLDLLGFRQHDPQLARRLHSEVLDSCLDGLVDRFYSFLQNDPEMAPFLDGPETVARLRQTHRAYLRSLGIDYPGEAYFEERLRIGVAHARIGLPLGLYLAAYRLLVELIVECFPAALRADAGACLAMSGFVQRVAMLDMSLAIDIYHQVEVEELVDSLRSVADERKQLVAAVQQDALTRLASRRHALERLQEYLARASTGQQPLSIAMADLDHFKAVNDRLGHLIGDRVLQDVANRILTSVRGRDLVGRYGGEEFLLLFPDTSLEVAGQVAERIREHVAATPVHLPEATVPVTLSLGLGAYRVGDSAKSLLERADQALYTAKHSGRNRVVLQS